MTHHDGVLVAMERKPAMRGTLHAAMATLAPAGLVLLLLIADTPSAYVGASIFAASLCALYTASASYHLGPWRGGVHGVMKRIDHAMIFVLIAGTYTPFCLVVLGYGAWGITMLALVWSLAFAGIALKVAWPSAPRWLSVTLYLSLGWLALVASPELAFRLSPAELTLLVLGGALYSVGGLVYATRRPDPVPSVFGFHEVFHALVIAGSLAHFVLIAAFILPA